MNLKVPSNERPVVIAIDAGTTGIRTRAVSPDAATEASAYREFTQYYPEPGWVEHDPTEIWECVAATLVEVVNMVGRDRVAAIGITNQRETVLVWDRTTGEPVGRALVWQDRRTAQRCDDIVANGHLDQIRALTGLVCDPYFSATKAAWLIEHRDVPAQDCLAIGTIDAWLIWKLTGGDVFATDVTNASRTMLFDIVAREWSPQLCDLFGVPIAALPEVRPSSGRFGVTSVRYGVPAGIPVSGCAGDQQAALFGQACVEPGMAKNTYGTGSFVLMNVGTTCPPPADGMLTTIAWDLGDGTPTYAREGAIFITGAAVQWLRDGLGVIASADEVGALAATVDDAGGVVVVPAFVGLGAPWWDPYARGSIMGITRGTTAAHIARAVVESMAYQTRDVIDAMAKTSGMPADELRVDGGAGALDMMLQFQADQLGIPVVRSQDHEATSLGAAYLAGLAEGVWASVDDIAQRWASDARFTPVMDPTLADLGHQQWLRAVERSRGWAE